MAQNQKSYHNEFKSQAVKLAKEGYLSANEAVHTPKNALSLNDELIELRKRVKEQDKEIRRLYD